VERGPYFLAAMDPLSISASLAGLLGIATQVATTGYKIGKKLAGAEEEVLRLTAEVTGLVGVLHSLQFMVSQFGGQDTTGGSLAVIIPVISAWVQILSLTFSCRRNTELPNPILLCNSYQDQADSD